LNNSKVLTPPAKFRWAIFLVLALLALAIRLPQLGERPMHTDESINAYITGQLLGGGKYHYDPQDRHGPALTELALPIVRLQGAESFAGLTESELRLTPVIVGTAMILLFGAAVEMFGFIPCLIATLLFAFAPLPVYYNRYFIHETLFVTATLGLILSGWRALKSNSILSAALAGFCAAFMVACKETVVIHFFALGLAAAVSWRFGSKKTLPAKRTWLAAALTFLIAGVLLFTWGGQNWTALADLLRAIPSFAARAGGEGHAKPFWYYFELLAGGWSGVAILLLALLGFFRVTVSSRRIFLAAYGVIIVLIYSAIPYKTPWLALNFWLPLALLAGLAVGWIWFALPKLSARAGILAGLGVIGILMAHDTRQWVFREPADEKNPYAYAHTGEDMLRLPVRLEQLAQKNQIASPRIAVVAADAWPLPWYLRKFTQVGFWQPGQETGAADYFITTTDVPDALAERLKNFRPEFFGWRPNVLLILWVPETQTP
jgi:uncharacterized protein (TIGR03663 family)